MKFIDDFLNTITMYRLVLYYLIILVASGIILSMFGVMPFSPFALAFSVVFLLAVGYVTNFIFGYIFDVPTNVESVYISALILALIITPVRSLHDFGFLFWAAVLTMASKFIVNIKGKHIFNPVALAVLITSLTISGSATWWVGSLPMLPFVLLGILIVIKTRRFDMVSYFFLAYLIGLVGFGIFGNINILTSLEKGVTDSPLLFFAFIMLTEPLTTPPITAMQSIYGGLVGLMFSPQFHIGSLYFTPEMALIAGNIFSYTVSPKFKLMLTLKEKIKISDDIYDFVFTRNQKFNFIPGQYMEWTYKHNGTDSRGNRRYFTLASSPTEDDVRLGVKFYPNSSSYKRSMLNMKIGEKIMAGNLMGDFTLPKGADKKLVFIAGGIGITPFRSMIKYLIDKKDKRDLILLYSAKTPGEIAYNDVFSQAYSLLGMKTYYTLTSEEKIPAGWGGMKGRFTPEVIAKLIPDFRQRTFYISGSHRMVSGFEDSLKSMGIPSSQIVTDFFPGLM